MKKYIQPGMAIYKVKVQSLLETTSLDMSSTEVDGSAALSKKRNGRNKPWQDDEFDEWDEEELNNGVRF